MEELLPHLVQLCPIAQWVIHPSGITFSHLVPVLVRCLCTETLEKGGVSDYPWHPSSPKRKHTTFTVGL